MNNSHLLFHFSSRILVIFAVSISRLIIRRFMCGVDQMLYNPQFVRHITPLCVQTAESFVLQWRLNRRIALWGSKGDFGGATNAP